MMEARCIYCGCPRGDLMAVCANNKDDRLKTEFCDECIENHYDEIMENVEEEKE